jgi:hypothetical protein
MNAHSPAPIDDIAEAVRSTCILATVRLRALGLTRTDKDASRDVVRQNNASAGAARVVVSRLPGADEFHNRITQAQGQARADLIALTMPYGNDEGWRLLPNANFEPLLAKLTTSKGKVTQLLDELKVEAPNIIARAKANMGTLNVPIPTVDELIGSYAIDVEFREIAEGAFKGLPDATASKLRRHVQRNLAAAVERATNDTMGRFIKPLEYFVERMRLFDERERAIAAGRDVGRTGVFRDSVVENIKELAEVVGSLNVTNDPRLDKLAAEVQALIIEPEALRDSQPKREEAVQVASNILADLSDWLN